MDLRVGFRERLWQKQIEKFEANIERRNVLERRNTCAKASVSGGSRISKKTKTGGLD